MTLGAALEVMSVGESVYVLDEYGLGHRAWRVGNHNGRVWPDILMGCARMDTAHVGWLELRELTPTPTCLTCILTAVVVTRS